MSKVSFEEYKKTLPDLPLGLKIPEHLAIVMDGNGRWAKEKGLPVEMGHQAGAKALRKMLYVIEKWSIKYLTVFAFSTENWKRERKEVEALMALMKYYLENYLPDLVEKKVRLKVIGNVSQLDSALQEKIKYAEIKTKEDYKSTLVVALNYGARQEILMAAKKLAKEYKEKKIDLPAINEEDFSALLYTAEIPDPDLFIRSSGEFRMSNFLLWQNAYAELFFTSTLWPDFSHEDLLEAIKSYNKRERRYGERIS